MSKLSSEFQKLLTPEDSNELEEILLALKDKLLEMGEGLPIPTVIGILEIMKHEIIQDAEGDDG